MFQRGPRMTITLNHYMVVSFLLFSIGFMGVLVRRNFLTILMSVELMLNAVNLNLIAFSRRLSDLTGQVFSIFVITIAAGEAAIGLALTISFFRQRKTLDVEEARTMRG
jgi:NADH-quinone oxidoreductase subunit K